MKKPPTRLLILGSSRLAESEAEPYLGTYRYHPDYQTEFGPDHVVNQAFGRFCEQGGESLVLSDIDLARHVVTVYA